MCILLMLRSAGKDGVVERMRWQKGPTLMLPNPYGCGTQTILTRRSANSDRRTVMEEHYAFIQSTQRAVICAGSNLVFLREVVLRCAHKFPANHVYIGLFMHLFLFALRLIDAFFR